jgi:hypothetical protein
MNIIQNIIKKNKKEEKFIQKQIYIDDNYFEPKQENKSKEEKVERGVIIIDLF